MSFFSHILNPRSSAVIHYSAQDSVAALPESEVLKAALGILSKTPDRPDLRAKCIPSYTSSRDKAFINGPLNKDRLLLQERVCRGQQVDLTCIDGVKIDAFYEAGTCQKAILFLHGNGGFYETCWSQAIFIRDMIDEDVHLMMFNPRGTGLSEGVPCGKNLALDVMAAFLFLVEKMKIEPSNILIYGHSMGGCIGALGAQLIQEIYPEHPIHLVSDRSFSSMTDHLDTFFQRKDEPGFFARGVPRSEPIDGWQMDAIEAILSLKGRVCIIYHPNDEIILKTASLFYQMQKKLRFSPSQFFIIGLAYHATDGELNHSRPLYAGERDMFSLFWHGFHESCCSPAENEMMNPL